MLLSIAASPDFRSSNFVAWSADKSPPSPAGASVIARISATMRLRRSSRSESFMEVSPLNLAHCPRRSHRHRSLLSQAPARLDAQPVGELCCWLFHLEDFCAGPLPQIPQLRFPTRGFAARPERTGTSGPFCRWRFSLLSSFLF